MLLLPPKFSGCEEKKSLESKLLINFDYIYIYTSISYRHEVRILSSVCTSSIEVSYSYYANPINNQSIKKKYGTHPGSKHLI